MSLMECERERVLPEFVRKASPPPFLLKTYMLVEDPATDAVISWNDDGTAFVVWQPAEFARDLLPALFKHSNFSSFIRQLNTYGFRKVATNRWEFSNDMFRKGKRDHLWDIRRRKSMPNKPQPKVKFPAADNEEQISLSTSSSSEFTSLIDENTRLKRENGVLNSEVAVMKKKYEELLDLVALYEGNSDKEEQSLDTEQDNNGGLKLFGVRLEIGYEKGR